MDKMDKEVDFTSYLRRWGMVFLLSLAAAIFVFDILYSYHEFSRRIVTVRERYVTDQKELLKSEVNHIDDLLGYVRYAGRDFVDQYLGYVRGFVTGQGSREGCHVNLYMFKILDIDAGDGFARVYASSGCCYDAGSLLSDTMTDAKGREYLKEVIAGVKEDGESFVLHWLDGNGKGEKALRQKLGYYKLTDDKSFIVAGEVCLDDVEKDIVLLQESLVRGLICKSIFFFVFIFSIIFLFLVILHRFSGGLKREIALFVSFFSRSVTMNESIDISLLKFSEFKQIAESANRMLCEKNEANARLEENIERFKQMASLTFEGIIIHKGGVVLDVNSSFERITGYTKNEIIGKNIVEIAVPAEYIGEVNRKVKEKATLPYEIKIRLKDGSLIPVELESRDVTTSRGEEFRVTAVRDIRERKKIEEERIRLSKLESLGVLAGGIAHDFNNILTGIMGNIELAKDKIVSANPSLVYLNRAQEAGERAAHLAGQFLTFSKGGVSVFEVLDVSALAREVVKFNLTGGRVRAEFHFPDNLSRVRADKGQLSQVIANLVLNAKQAMPKGGTVTIEGENLDDFVVIRVKDEGCGIPEDKLDKIFDPFFTTKEGGHGLGLSTVYSIVKKHGGKIEVTSMENRGTVFSVFIPAGDDSGEVSSSSLSTPLDTDVSHSGCILVMDDEKIILDVVEAMLTSRGYCVKRAQDGESALSMYMEAMNSGKPFDAVILDLTIPGGMGGREAVLKILEINPNAKVIASSGYTTNFNLEDFRDYGFAGVLGKPFGYEELLNELERVLSK